MFTIVKQDSNSAVSKALPVACAELNQLLNRDGGKLFGNQISYSFKERNPALADIYSNHIIILGNNFITPDNLYSSAAESETVKHDMKKLRSPLSIGVKRVMGGYIAEKAIDRYNPEQVHEPTDYTVLRITAVDNFISAILPKIIGIKTGSAQLYSWTKLFKSEQEITAVLNYLKDLDGAFTPYSLIKNLDTFDFASKNIRRVENELTGSVGMKF